MLMFCVCLLHALCSGCLRYQVLVVVLTFLCYMSYHLTRKTISSVKVCVCVCACVRACVHACVRACMRVCMHSCVCTCVLYLPVCRAFSTPRSVRYPTSTLPSPAMQPLPYTMSPIRGRTLHPPRTPTGQKLVLRDGLPLVSWSNHCT